MIPHNNVSGYCGHCYSQPLVNNAITVKDIEYWVINFSWTRASKELGLSDNGLRKRYTKLTGKSPKEIRPEYEC